LAKDLRETGLVLFKLHNDGIVAGTGLLWTLNDSENNGTRILNKKYHNILLLKGVLLLVKHILLH